MKRFYKADVRSRQRVTAFEALPCSPNIGYFRNKVKAINELFDPASEELRLLKRRKTCIIKRKYDCTKLKVIDNNFIFRL